jgi:hypothetical protein
MTVCGFRAVAFCFDISIGYPHDIYAVKLQKLLHAITLDAAFCLVDIKPAKRHNGFA